MAKADKTTVTKRIHEVLKLLLAGGEFEDIRQYATAKVWKVSDRQLRRYQEWAYERLAEATNQNQKQLMGRHLMQRRGLYARALKTNDVRTALLVLKDEAALEGIYPPTKIAPTTPDGLYPYGFESGPPLSREERFKRLLAAEAKDDKDELRLLEQVTPRLIYQMPDTKLPLQMLNICALTYVAEQLDHASMLLMATLEVARNQGNADGWSFIADCHGFYFKTEVDAWELFTGALGIDSQNLIKANYFGSALELCGDRIYEMAPTREQMLELLATEDVPPEKLLTPQKSAREWHHLLNQVLRS